MPFQWDNLSDVVGISYTCAYCDSKVAPNKGFQASNSGNRNNQTAARVVICPNCTRPTFLGSRQVPPERLGDPVEGITDPAVKALYNEARECTSASAYTAATLCCRKILMNLAVQHEAKEGESFQFYIDFLEQNGWVPPNGKAWVDQIRKKGNEATHEIRRINKEEAEEILRLTRMLLLFAYEFAMDEED